MAAPSAYKTSKDKRRKDRKGEEDESRIDRTILERIYRFGGFYRRDRAARDAPLYDVSDHQ